ncbi:hypothetical protein K439DRAFT_1617115 [Ramaria rubella]|nr:hypothetical protein K439DRAFT_1617115 [Ramaria rubella]
MWHRTADGILMHGTLNRTESCPARFELYYPYNLDRCPNVLLVCRNPHSHADPFPANTPQTVVNIFTDLLTHLDWKLANATPRRILLDSLFMAGLRQVLGWVALHDPILSDFHPSLGNFDHTARLINKLRYQCYPHGTGFEGAYHLLTEHCNLPPDEHMSTLLSLTKWPSIDTLFKRLDKWQEFEIEAWFPEYVCSIVVARAFTTSQSAAAHLILFTRIFAIVEQETGQIVHFRHIHGEGFDSVVADEHHGQGLGSSLKILLVLLRIAPKIRQAMMSLASAEPLPDLEGTLQLIRTGGKRAADWLKDKEAASGFSLAAIYQPASKIPLDMWKASPSTSNGNEQAH